MPGPALHSAGSVQNISRKGPQNCRSLRYAPPDFLLNLVAPVNSFGILFLQGCHKIVILSEALHRFIA